MNIRQQYYIFWVTAICGVLLTALGSIFYIQRLPMKKYTDKDSGFSINYPKNWAYATNKDGARAIFYTPAESDYDQFVENVNIAIQDISRNPMNISDYSAIVVRQMEEIFGQQTDIVESSDMTVSGRAGHKLIFVGLGENPVKMMIVWGIKGNDVYQVTYTAQVDSFNFYLDDVNKMIKSFRIL